MLPCPLSFQIQQYSSNNTVSRVQQGRCCCPGVSPAKQFKLYWIHEIMVRFLFSIPYNLMTLQVENASFIFMFCCKRCQTCSNCGKDMLEQLHSASISLSTGHPDPVLWGTRRTHLSINTMRKAELLKTTSLNITQYTITQTLLFYCCSSTENGT